MHLRAGMHTQKRSPVKQPSKSQKPPDKPAKASENVVEGEGSYTASRRYNDGLKAHVESGRSEELGRAAKKALEGHEAGELRRAEQRGKQARVR